ncbi:MAG: hypothetical protein WA435_14215 [Gallionellaceae bacterium]
MLFTIIESDIVAAELERLRNTYPRFDDWWVNGWSWRLARDPIRDAAKIGGRNPITYLLKTSPHHASLGFPFTLTFLYTVTENEVVLENIRFVEIKEE